VKQLFPHKKILIWLFWMGSLGLHGLLLMVPMSAPEQPIEEKTVKVVARPRQPVPKPPSPPVIARNPPVAKAKPSPKPSLPQRPPVIIASPTPLPTLTPTAEAPKPSPSPSPQPDPSPTPEEPGLGDVLSNFAEVDGAKPGCQNTKKDCWRLEDTHWRTVAGNLEQRFEAKGYKIGEMDERAGEGMKIYEVSKPGKPPSYLHFLSTLKGTVYYLNSEPLSVKELEDIVGV
jgi:hypothetical protein